MLNISSICCLNVQFVGISELVNEDSETDWMEKLKAALKEAEKYTLPMAVFKVFSA